MLPTSLLEGIPCKCQPIVLIMLVSLTIHSIGTCQRYLGQSNLCNDVYNPSDYIFTAMNQTLLANELDNRIFYVLRDSGECGDLISKVLCHYFFAPCGANGLLHLPLSICPEECNFVEAACAKQLGLVNNLLRGSANLNIISCRATGALLQGLSPCCIDAGIEIRGIIKAIKVSMLIDMPPSSITTRFACDHGGR